MLLFFILIIIITIGGLQLLSAIIWINTNKNTNTYFKNQVQTKKLPSQVLKPAALLNTKTSYSLKY